MSPPTSEQVRTIDSLNYRELQQRAGELGVKRSGKTEELKTRIVNALEETQGKIVSDYDQDVLSDPEVKVVSPRSRRKTQTSPKSVVQSSRRKSAAEAASPANGQQHDPDASGTAADTHHGTGWARRVQQTPQRVSEWLDSATKSARQSVSKLQLPDSIQDAFGLSPQKPQKRRGRPPKKQPATWQQKLRASLPSYSTFLSWFILFLAATAAFTALGLAYRHRHQIGDAVKTATHTADKGLRHTWDTFQHVGSRVSHTLQHQLHRLWARLPSVPSATKPTLGGKPAADALLDLVPRQPQWAGTRDALLTVLTGRRYFANKAAAVVLAGTQDSSRRAATHLTLGLLKSQPGQAHCLMLLRGQSLAKGDAQARGHLQSQLARTLLGCPNAIIIVEGLQQMHPGLLPIWINGLSEQGSFVLDGATVPSTRATYIFTAAVPKDLLQLETEEDLSRAVKSHLVSTFHEARDSPLQSGEATAFRGRIDIVAPLLS